MNGGAKFRAKDPGTSRQIEVEQTETKRPGEFRGLRGPEKKSAKSEVRGMKLIKVREIRGPRNEFLQKSAKSEVRGMSFYKSPRNPRSAE